MDLSKNQYSATATYIRILPELEKIATKGWNEPTKCIRATDLILASLIESRNLGHRAISQNYIIKVKTTLSKMTKMNAILAYVNRAIQHGKNYERKD